MSDSPSPNGGPSPYDGWDLEGVLSGTPGRLPEGMRRVARTLEALRAAPLDAELAGEASARAMFRQNLPAGGVGLSRPGGGAGSAHLVTRAPHSHRRPSRRRRWRLAALAGTAAAAAAIVGASALAGTFSGAGGHLGQAGNSAGVTSATTPAGGASPANGLEGSATKAPTARPTAPSGSASRQASGDQDTQPGSQELCRQYLAFVATHPGPHAVRAAENGDFKQLSDLAGGPKNIGAYCMRFQLWAAAQPGGPALPPSDDSSGSQNSQGSSGGQDAQAPQETTLPTQSAKNGNKSGQNGNGKQNKK